MRFKDNWTMSGALKTIPLLFLLIGCSATTVPVFMGAPNRDLPEINYAEPDPESMEPCLWSEDIPLDADGDEQERILIQNRLRGDDCKIRHDSLRRYVTSLLSVLTGE